MVLEHVISASMFLSLSLMIAVLPVPVPMHHKVVQMFICYRPDAMPIITDCCRVHQQQAQDYTPGLRRAANLSVQMRLT